MTRSELSRKICEGLQAVFGSASHNPDMWLSDNDYATGRVSVTERAMGARDAEALCRRLESAIGANTKVTSAVRAPESFIFTIAFDKNEAVYTDGKNTIASIEKDGKKYMVDASGNAVPVADDDKYVANLNKSTGSNYRKAEALLRRRLEEAGTALDGTGFTIGRENDTIRIGGSDKDALAAVCDDLPYGDEYYGSGLDSDGDVIIIIPSELFGVEEIADFIDAAVVRLIEWETPNDGKSVEDWAECIDMAEGNENMARRFEYLKDGTALVDALPDDKFAEAVASVRNMYGDSKAESVLTLRLGAEKARNVVETLKPLKKTHVPQKNVQRNVLEALLDDSHNDVAGRLRHPQTKINELISKNMRLNNG